MALLRFRSGSDPLDDLLRLQRQLDQFFGAASMGGSLALPGRGVFPPVDVFDKGDAVVVKTELPGMKLQDIELVTENDTLTISGKRTIRFDAEKPRFHRRERDQGEFRRVVRLPAKLNTEAAKATYGNGVLTVTIPKAKESQPRQISVQAA